MKQEEKIATLLGNCFHICFRGVCTKICLLFHKNMLFSHVLQKLIGKLGRLFRGVFRTQSEHLRSSFL